MKPLRQTWPMPAAPRPVVLLGCGSIVVDAHLPAYRKAGFPVAGIYDLDTAKAAEVARQWNTRHFTSLGEAVAEPDAVFDLATPPSAHLAVLNALPDGATVLIQKPMGRNLAEASDILRLCRAKKLVAAVNFQLRFAPMMLALRDAVERGLLGDLIDVEVHLNLVTPWELFAFLRGIERVEIAVHSIHYLDLIRSLLGNPAGVHAHTLGHPATDMAQTRTSAILRFGDGVRCCLSINHNHDFGRRFQDAAVDLPRYPVRALQAVATLPAPLARGILARRIAGARGQKPPSLLLDLRAARNRTEVDYLNGAVAREARAAGVAAPVNAVLARVVSDISHNPQLWVKYRERPEALAAEVAAESGRTSREPALR